MTSDYNQKVPMERILRGWFDHCNDCKDDIQSPCRCNCHETEM